MKNNEFAVKYRMLREEAHLIFQENQRGITYDKLFGPYLAGAKEILITDPYIGMFFQIRNLMELMETIVKLKPEEDEVKVHLASLKIVVAWLLGYYSKTQE